MVVTNQVDPPLARKTINDFEMHYMEVGKGEPLVLLHGSFSDLRYWAPQMEAFGSSYRVFAPSLRPFWPRVAPMRVGEFDVAQYVNDLAAFLRALDVGPVHLCGHSLGGSITLLVARRFPELVSSLILAEPGGPFDNDIMPLAPDENGAGIMAALTEAAANVAAGEIDAGLEIMLGLVSPSGRGWSTAPEAYKRVARANAHTIVAQAVGNYTVITAADVAAVRVPVLLIGGACTPEPFPTMLAALEKGFPNAQRATIPNATHIMSVENPLDFNRDVLAFLARIVSNR